jgi:hypothetical protein
MPSTPTRARRSPDAARLSGGPAVMVDLLATRLHCRLDPAQAQALWTECEAHLRALELTEIIVEVQESADGGLDTFPREYVLDALGETLAGLPWPLNMDGAAHGAAFRQKMASALTARGFVLTRPHPAQ